MFREIETERLFERKIREEDIPLLWENFYKNYEDCKFFSYERINSYKDFYEIEIKKLQKYKERNYYKWAITEKESGVLLGMINLHHYDEMNRQIKVGYFLFPNERKKGYAKESLLSIIQFAFDEIGVHRIIATTIEGNRASDKVLKAAGFQLEGTKRKDHYIDGNYYDSHIFGLLEGDINGKKTDEKTNLNKRIEC